MLSFLVMPGGFKNAFKNIILHKYAQICTKFSVNAVIVRAPHAQICTNLHKKTCLNIKYQKKETIQIEGRKEKKIESYQRNNPNSVCVIRRHQFN